MLWWSNVLEHGDGARQISTRELDPHVFSGEVDWTTRHAFSGAYNPLRRGCGIGRAAQTCESCTSIDRVGSLPPMESRSF